MRFVRDFAKLYVPLIHLKRVDVKFHSTKEHSTKEQTNNSNTSRFGHFNQHARSEIHKNANTTGLAAVLDQIQERSQRVIAYASRKLTKVEGNYSMTEKQYLAFT